jgi:hypothetical protein
MLGTLKVVEEEEPLEMEIETVASDGTLLKGILHGQKIGDTVISSLEVTIITSLQTV